MSDLTTPALVRTRELFLKQNEDKSSMRRGRDWRLIVKERGGAILSWLGLETKSTKQTRKTSKQSKHVSKFSPDNRNRWKYNTMQCDEYN